MGRAQRNPSKEGGPRRHEEHEEDSYRGVRGGSQKRGCPTQRRRGRAKDFLAADFPETSAYLRVLRGKNVLFLRRGHLCLRGENMRMGFATLYASYELSRRRRSVARAAGNRENK